MLFERVLWVKKRKWHFQNCNFSQYCRRHKGQSSQSCSSQKRVFVILVTFTKLLKTLVRSQGKLINIPKIAKWLQSRPFKYLLIFQTTFFLSTPAETHNIQIRLSRFQQNNKSFYQAVGVLIAAVLYRIIIRKSEDLICHECQTIS